MNREAIARMHRMYCVIKRAAPGGHKLKPSSSGAGRLQDRTEEANVLSHMLQSKNSFEHSLLRRQVIHLLLWACCCVIHLLYASEQFQMFMKWKFHLVQLYNDRRNQLTWHTSSHHSGIIFWKRRSFEVENWYMIDCNWEWWWHCDWGHGWWCQTLSIRMRIRSVFGGSAAMCHHSRGGDREHWNAAEKRGRQNCNNSCRLLWNTECFPVFWINKLSLAPQRPRGPGLILIALL